MGSSAISCDDVGSPQQPLASIQPGPRNGEAIRIGARRLTWRAGARTTVRAITTRSGALDGSR